MQGSRFMNNGTAAAESPTTVQSQETVIQSPSEPLPSSLAQLANASPEQIRLVLGMMPKTFLDNVEAALPSKKNEPPAPFPDAPVSAIVEPPKPSTPMFAFDPPPNFEVTPIDFALYDPERCGGRSILGILYGMLELPKQTSAGQALRIMLLEPTLVVDNTGRVFEARASQDIIVEASWWLLPLVRRAMDEQKVGEVWLRPLRKIACVGGDFHFEWALRHGRLHDRATFRQLVQKAA